MRQEDMPTPETDAWIAKWDLWNSSQDWPDGLAGPISDVSHAKRLERCLALAVAALKDIRTADDDCVCDSGYSANTVAIETIAQIEEGK